MDKLKNILVYVFAFIDSVKETIGNALKHNNKKGRKKDNLGRNTKESFVRCIKRTFKEGTPAQKRELKSNIIFLGVVAVMLVGITILALNLQDREFSYEKELDEVLFIYEGKEVELRAVSYYIMIEEEAVNQSALEYDPFNANSYWNLHVDEGYLSDQAKKTALDYCVRDVLYAYKAKEAGIKLKDSQIKDLEQKAKNIYEGLTEKQQEIGLTEEDIYEAIYNNRLADEWVLMLARKDDVTITEQVLSAYYGINSYFFRKTKAELDFVLNEKLWEEVRLGSLTIN